MISSTPLDHEHTEEAIAERLGESHKPDDLGDFVLGAVDGAITTFAIVAGVAGAGLSAGVAIVLGLANVLADGFSMAVGNYLKTRSDQQMRDRRRRAELRHIQQAPEGEREEVRQIYAAKGFEGETLEKIVAVITADTDRWVDTMLSEEFGLQATPGSPTRAATITFLAFVGAGLAPIAPLALSAWYSADVTFALSTTLTLLTFAAIGAIRGRVADISILRGAVETVAIGAVAAGLAYAVGDLLRGLTGS